MPSANAGKTPFVCAFRGRRDSYQVPLALAEAGRLDCFITDAWAGPLLRRLPLPEKLAGRGEPSIPSARVRCLWWTTAREHLRHRLGFSPIETWAQLDAEFSHAAAAHARRTGADLFLYSPYAWEAFTAVYPGRRMPPRRVLFQYHPHPMAENRLLDADLSRFPEVAHSHAEATGKRLPETIQRRNMDLWRHADLIFCASSFTRDTLLEVGANPARCVVVPYGVNTNTEEKDDGNDDAGAARRAAGIPFRVLFVGSGVQRKGLHHLLRAWAAARLPAGSTLSLVCRVLDPGLRALVSGTPGVSLRPGVGRRELAALYQESSLMAMPSLVEGFGQVFLEALAAGCPVLGTANTCLPDLGGEADGVFLTQVADLEDLTFQLERLAAWLPGRPELRARARAGAGKFTWAQFRRTLVARL